MVEPAGLRGLAGACAGVLAATLLLASGGCQKLGLGGSRIKAGSTVKMHYTLKVDGAVVDSSSGKEPLTYVQGQGQIIPGLEEQIAGLGAGVKRTFTVSAEKGYGQVRPEAYTKVPRKSLQNLKGLKVGSMVSGESGSRPFQAVVSALGAKEITLNLNHPLAGKTLNFDIEIVEVQPPRT